MSRNTSTQSILELYVYPDVDYWRCSRLAALSPPPVRTLQPLLTLLTGSISRQPILRHRLTISHPFQDVSTSPRINLLSPNDLSLNYRYDFADHFASDGVASSSDSGPSYNVIGFNSGSIPTSVQQLEMFNQHNRMLSLGSTSTSTTLINTPLPRSLTGFPTAPGFSIKSPFSPPNLFVCSPGTKFMQNSSIRRPSALIMTWQHLRRLRCLFLICLRLSGWIRFRSTLCLRRSLRQRRRRKREGRKFRNPDPCFSLFVT